MSNLKNKYVREIIVDKKSSFKILTTLNFPNDLIQILSLGGNFALPLKGQIYRKLILLRGLKKNLLKLHKEIWIF